MKVLWYINDDFVTVPNLFTDIFTLKDDEKELDILIHGRRNYYIKIRPDDCELIPFEEDFPTHHLQKQIPTILIVSGKFSLQVEKVRFDTIFFDSVIVRNPSHFQPLADFVVSAVKSPSLNPLSLKQVLKSIGSNRDETLSLLKEQLVPADLKLFATS